MPRTVAPVLRKMYERSNPRVRNSVEIHRPNVSRILRRIDQFFGAEKVSEVPAATLEADATGGLSLARGSTQVASFFAENTSFDLKKPDLSRHVRGVLWTPDPAFPASIAKKVSVRIHRNSAQRRTLGLQVYKISRQIFGTQNPGIRVATPKGTSGRILTTFVPLLANPVTRRTNQQTAGGNNVGDFCTFEFDLSGLDLSLRRSGLDLLGQNGLELSGEDVRYFFVVECLDGALDDEYKWICDSATARTVAGVGTFDHSEWTNGLPGNAAAWAESPALALVPTFKLDVETVVATSVAVYAVDVGAVPSEASAGRILFERAEPTGTSAALAISTAGAGGPWTVVTHGDAVATKQQAYHLRVTLNADAALRQSPKVLGFGIEFRETVDGSFEAVVEPVAQAINVPFCEATIGQGSINLVRTGRRDYRDAGSDLAVGGAASALEAEIHLASDHPAVARKDWLTICRAPVSDRAPTQTSERFTLLSLLKQLQGKVPAREETVSRIYTVVAATVSEVTVDVSGDIDDVSGDWDGLQYYMRVRSSDEAGVETSYVQTIDTSTAPDKLGFSPALPGTLVAGDVIEVHSGRFSQPTLRWEDEDPADIWMEVITVLRAIPEERIGRADLGSAGRSGLPPRVTDRAPGDAATQAKLKVTLELQKAEDADKLIDQLSFLMGGATIEVAGQIVFRQIYPLRDITGAIVVPVQPIAAVFDEANTIGLDTPSGLERRITSIACDYGVDTTLVAEDTDPAETTEYADVDALAWLAQQDLHELGHEVVPKDIARWCYNSVDGGLLLASLMCQQVVFVASTGLRVWSWGSTEAKPNLVVGDRVVIITDQYTDFDPTRMVEIRGRWGFPLVITEVAAGGRRFRGLQTGLSTASPNVRGGPGDLNPFDTISALEASSLNDFKWTDSPDGLLRTFSMRPGSRVRRVAVFLNTLEVPPQFDPWPSDGVLPVTILTPNPVTGLVTYEVAKPSLKYQKFIQFEPRRADWTVGTIRRVVVDPSPSAMAATLHGAVTEAMVDVSADIRAGVADWPVQVDFYIDSPFSAAVATTTLNANATLDKNSAGLATLGGIALPQRELRRVFVKLTNVADEVIWGEPLGVDRDALPFASVTVNDFRAAPWLKVSYDDDTDEVKFYLSGGKTKTFAGLSGSGTVTYNVGDAVDVGAPESALAIDESRSGYRVDIKGGGQYLTIWGSGANEGVLHGQTTGPSLTVTATPGSSTYDISYSGTGVITYSIDGGAFTTPPASPILGIARSATADKEYRFKCVQAGQTIMNTVIIPSLQKDAISPDLAVTPGTPTSTVQPFTVTATNPSGGAAPTITVTPYNCSIVIAGLTYTTPQVVASGTVVTANRPSTVTDTQAHVKFVAAIAGAGSEEIDMEIVSQLNFGPTLDVTAAPSATATGSYSITWGGSGTITLSIDGGAYNTPGASPITVFRHDTLDNTYTFKAVKDGQDIVNTVTIPSLKSDGLVPNLTVVPTLQASTHTDYTVTFTNPRTGGTAPTGIAQAYGLTQFRINGGTLWSEPDGPQAIASGDVIRAHRPPSTTTEMSHIRFQASIAGGGSEHVKLPVPNFINLGPTLVVTPTPGDASWSIAYSGTGTITYSTDGGSYSTPGASPISVTRTANDQTITFKAVLDGQTVTAPVTVPGLVTTGAAGITSVSLSNRFHPCDGGGSLDVSWTHVGLPDVATFDVLIEVDADSDPGANDPNYHSQYHAGKNSGDTCNIDLCPTSTGKVTVFAMYGGNPIASKSKDF